MAAKHDAQMKCTFESRKNSWRIFNHTSCVRPQPRGRRRPGQPTPPPSPRRKGPTTGAAAFARAAGWVDAHAVQVPTGPAAAGLTPRAAWGMRATPSPLVFAGSVRRCGTRGGAGAFSFPPCPRCCRTPTTPPSHGPVGWRWLGLCPRFWNRVLNFGTKIGPFETKQ